MPLSARSLPTPTIDLYTLTGTQDTTATFDEHEALKTILRQGSGTFEINTVCEVHTRRAPFPVFPIFTASIGSKDPLAPVEAGRDSARNIEGSRLEIIEGMAQTAGLLIGEIEGFSQRVVLAKAY